jgi:hypothetical protein
MKSIEIGIQGLVWKAGILHFRITTTFAQIRSTKHKGGSQEYVINSSPFQIPNARFSDWRRTGEVFSKKG